jgi:hypothetical protein
MHLMLVFILSIVVAAFPWRSRRNRVAVLSTHLAGSIALPMMLAPWQVWAIAVSPGTLIAVIKLFRTLNGWYVEPPVRQRLTQDSGRDQDN